MEFVGYEEAINLLNEQGIYEVDDGQDLIGLTVESDDEEVVNVHLACTDSTAPPLEGAEVVRMEKSRLAATVEHILHKLHLAQVLLVPASKWRKVFDAVAFSMAGNEEWQAVDTAAAVALNTRDPLLCEPADFHTVGALIAALLSDATSPDQGFTITTTASPVVIEIVPDGAVRITVGNPVLADEVAETFTSTR